MIRQDQPFSVKRLRDKNEREIKPGDVLKVFHFTGARSSKRHYMIKQAVAYDERGYLKISHLENWDGSKKDEIGTTYYLERADGRLLADYEIIQR